jgi:hypothetical protein
MQPPPSPGLSQSRAVRRIFLRNARATSARVADYADRVRTLRRPVRLQSTLRTAIPETMWISIRDTGCKSREQCLSLRPVLKPACLVDVAKLSHFHDAASPLARFPAGIFDRAIWIVRARDDEGGKPESARRRIGKTCGLDGEGLALRIRNRNEECARDRRCGNLLPVCNQKTCQAVSDERRLRSGADCAIRCASRRRSAYPWIRFRRIHGYVDAHAK